MLPAFNEEATITAVISEIDATLPGFDCLVVNDGSADATTAVARDAGAVTAELPFNLGVGGAMRLGFKYAVQNGYDAVVQVDADGQHDPSAVPALLARLDDADIVIGARFAGVGDYQTGGIRRFAMRVIAAVLSRTAKTKLTDTTSGFKAMGPRAVALFAENYPAEYLGDTIEALVIAARAGCRITQVPVTMRARAGGAPVPQPIQGGSVPSSCLRRARLRLPSPGPSGGSPWGCSMTPTGYILGVVSALITLVVVIEMLRRRRLRERHAVWWLLATSLALIAGLFPDLLTWAAGAVGVVLPTNLVFFVSIAVLVLVCIQHSAELTELESETRALAERTALLDLRVRELEGTQEDRASD